MIVSNKASQLWQKKPESVISQLTHILDRSPKAIIFFRADDVGIPSKKQDRLLRTFVAHGVPLCPAIVPAWLNKERWDQICTVIDNQHQFFCWHQHGWNHFNHQQSGKKQEFGPDLDRAKKNLAISRGREKLAGILGTNFRPFFTPPWNRVDAETMEILEVQGFHAISRYRGDKLAAPPTLPDLPANVDLHTRKEPSPDEGWQALLTELAQALTTGCAGIMIHHQRMNDAAFSFLALLLTEIRKRSHFRLVHFQDLLAKQATN